MTSGVRFTALAALAAALAASSAAAESRTSVQVTTVLATNAGRSFDAKLAALDLKSVLRPLRFKSYTMIRNDARTLRGSGEQWGIDLPGGRYLHLTTREHTSDHLRLHILLNENNRPVINTYVKLEPDSVVVLGGPRDTQGTLIISVGAKPVRAEATKEPPASARAREERPFASGDLFSRAPRAPFSAGLAPADPAAAPSGRAEREPKR